MSTEHVTPSTEAEAEAERCPFGPNGRDFNPFSAPNFADLYPQLETARHEAPVFFAEGLGMWIVSRYSDVLAVLKDSDTFSAAARGTLLSSFPAARDILERTATFSAPNFGFDGQPTHERLRGPISKYFSVASMALRERRMRDIAARCLADVPDEGPFDLMQSFASPVGGRVMMDLIGLPSDDHEELLAYHEAISAFFFGRPPEDRQREYADKILDFESYVTELIEERRKAPQDDLISYMLHRIEDGEADYSTAEMISLISFDVFAGGVRPAAFAIVNLCRQLLEDRRHWEGLRTDRGTFDRHLAESLRRSGMFIGVFRTTTRAAEVAGVAIPEGSMVWVMLTSANRDAERFADPNEFNPHRTNLASSLHLSHGLHYCLGGHLTRAVSRVGVDALMERFPGLRLVPDQAVEYEPGMNIMVPTSLLVEP